MKTVCMMKLENCSMSSILTLHSSETSYIWQLHGLPHTQVLFYIIVIYIYLEKLKI